MAHKPYLRESATFAYCETVDNKAARADVALYFASKTKIGLRKPAGLPPKVIEKIKLRQENNSKNRE